MPHAPRTIPSPGAARAAGSLTGGAVFSTLGSRMAPTSWFRGWAAWGARRARAHPVRTAAIVASAGTALARSASRKLAARAEEEPGPGFTRLPEGSTTKVTADDGAALSVTIAGPQGGPCVVLAHGWANDSTVWAPVARQLVLGGHRVVLYDQRGHGASTFGGGARDISRLGDDLATIIDELDLEDAVLVGHSMGGMSVQACVLGHPDLVPRVRGIVLVATSATMGFFPVPRVLAELALGDRHLAWTRRGRIGATLARSAFGSHARRAHVALVRDLLGSVAGDVRVACLMAMTKMDLRPGLPSLAMPTTILVGARDLLTPVPLSRAIASRVQGSRLEVIPGAGHMLPLERPGQVLDAVHRMTSGGRTR